MLPKYIPITFQKTSKSGLIAITSVVLINQLTHRRKPHQQLVTMTAIPMLLMPLATGPPISVIAQTPHHLHTVYQMELLTTTNIRFLQEHKETTVSISQACSNSSKFHSKAATIVLVPSRPIRIDISQSNHHRILIKAILRIIQVRTVPRKRNLRTVGGCHQTQCQNKFCIAHRHLSKKATLLYPRRKRWKTVP